MNISLTEALEEFTRKKVETGLYNNVSEVIRESLRLMIHRDEAAQILKDSVTRGLEQVERGEYTDVKTEAQFMKLARSRR